MNDRIHRVMITGAGSGIGLDMARAFLARGSRLVINGRDPEKLERVRRSLDPSQIVAVPGDIGDPATGPALADAAREHFGGVDVLVNNAGIFASKQFLESTAADLERFFETNVKGTYLVTQAIVPLMIAGGGGSIINVGAALVEQAMTGVPASAVMVSKGRCPRFDGGARRRARAAQDPCEHHSAGDHPHTAHPGCRFAGSDPSAGARRRGARHVGGGAVPRDRGVRDRHDARGRWRVLPWALTAAGR